MKTRGITHRIITNSRRAAIMLLLAMTALTTAWAQTGEGTGTGGEGGISIIPEQTPLTLEAIDDGTIVIIGPKKGMKYSTDGGVTKTPIEKSDEAFSISISKDETIQFYGDKTNITSYYGTNIRCNTYCYIYGNIMSLVNEEGFATATELLSESTFKNLFYDNDQLKNHPNNLLVLPATTLTKNCYQSMFELCKSLTKAPKLPATELAEGCYVEMFHDCTGLATAPSLPATTLAMNCYEQMFKGCEGLTKAPDLPATVLAEGCYKEMFNGCTKLSYVRCPATDISAGDCTTEWLINVAEQGTFLKAADIGWITGTCGIPDGWKVEDDMTCTPLTLQAIADGDITVSNPRSGMQYSIGYGKKTTLTATTQIPVKAGDKVQFYGSGTAITAYYNASAYAGTRINSSVPCYIYGNIMSLVNEKGYATATILPEAENTFRQLFYNASQLRNHPDYSLVLPAKTLQAGCYEDMFYGCTGLTTAPGLPAKTMKEYCYAGMFQGCTGLTAAPELPAKKLADYCYEDMFYDCTGLTTAPELPATTLAMRCYYQMFKNCSNLSYVKCLATDNSAKNCKTNWLENVAASGTFVKAEGMNRWSTGSSGIPSGWTVREGKSNGITLYDTADNTATLEGKDLKKVDYVVLAGRTLYKDGKWNTLCLPFKVSDGDATDDYPASTGGTDGISFTGTPLQGATVKTLTGASFDNGTLTLTFGDDVTAITAGTPYLVKWATKGTDLKSPVFDNVRIFKTMNDVAVADVITFKGTYAATTYAAENRSILFLGADNTLYTPEAGATIGAFRAYFQLADGLTCGYPYNPNSIRTFNLNFGDEDTGIRPPSGSPEGEGAEAFPREGLDGVWYTLDGRKLNGQPRKPGLYIHQGRKVAIK